MRVTTGTHGGGVRVASIGNPTCDRERDRCRSHRIGAIRNGSNTHQIGNAMI